MQDFCLDAKALSFLGQGLKRPESVLPMPDGRVYACDARGGIMEIAPDGTARLIGRETHAEAGFLPNGFTPMPDGSFLVANIGPEGGIWRLERNGDISPFLLEADGMRLGMPNFVFRDRDGRIWIATIPARKPDAYLPGVNQGFFVVVDERGARIVADGVDYPNEVRIDPVRGWVYTNETFLGRMLRFRLGPDGTMSHREVVAEFDRTDHLDGLIVDAEGHVWTTSTIVNRLYRVNPEKGTMAKVLEDMAPEWSERAAVAVESGRFSREILYEQHDELTLKNISSIAFGGPDLRTVWLGCLTGDRLATFRAPVAGMRPPHWDFEFPQVYR